MKEQSFYGCQYSIINQKNSSSNGKNLFFIGIRTRDLWVSSQHCYQQSHLGFKNSGILDSRVSGFRGLRVERFPSKKLRELKILKPYITLKLKPRSFETLKIQKLQPLKLQTLIPKKNFDF
jgi:hypothetical protein